MMTEQERLPEYLRMHVNAAPKPDSVFLFGSVRLTVITDRLIRIERAPFTDEATLTVLNRNFDCCEPKDTTDGTVHVIKTGALSISYNESLPFEQALQIQSCGKPAFAWHVGDRPLQNLGGTTSTLDGVNGACPLEDGLCSLDGYTVMDDSETPIILKDGWFAPREKGLDLYFFGYGHDYTACVQDYMRLTGAPDMLPAFVLGNWWSRYHAYTADEYLTLMDQFAHKDIPLSVGIVDMDWHLTDGDGRDYKKDGWTGYTWNDKLFPDYKAFVQGLHDRGLKTALNLHPSKGVRSWDVQYHAMCAAMGKDPEKGEPVPFNCLNPDFLKAYFEVLHFPYEEDGVDFWWMDWQQGNDYRAIAGDDYSDNGLDVISPLWMLNHMHYMASRRGGKRGLIFSRFSGYGSQRYPIGFSGDTIITWESLRFQPYFTLTASNVGYGWWSHDVGGHMNGYRDDELTVRWIQLGVFSPIFRLHSSNNLFLGREPWRYNKRAELIISDLMRLRHRLFPYLYTMNRRASSELIPLVRPMYHLYPECGKAYAVPNEYAFGSELIVAPITEKADGSDLAKTKAWLPEGKWIDAMNGYVYRGGQELDVYRPMEEMPLFMKAGAIIPLQAHKPGRNNLDLSDAMEALIAPGADGKFTLYEDDGETLDYQQGVFCETDLTLDWHEKNATFTVHPSRGALSMLPERSWTLHFRGFAKGCTLVYRGIKLPVSYEPDTCTYSVTVSGIDPMQGFSIEICNEAGLMHDDSDVRDRIIRKLERAQNTLEAKNMMLKLADEILEKMKTGEAFRFSKFASDRQPSLGGCMFELISQLDDFKQRIP